MGCIIKKAKIKRTTIIIMLAILLNDFSSIILTYILHYNKIGYIYKGF